MTKTLAKMVSQYFNAVTFIMNSFSLRQGHSNEEFSLFRKIIPHAHGNTPRLDVTPCWFWNAPCQKLPYNSGGQTKAWEN